MAVEFSKLSFMVVDDDPAQRALVSGMLRQLGAATLDEADDGAAALQKMAQRPPVDIIVSDLDMPGMDGVEFIRHLGSRHLASALILASAMDPVLIGSVEAMARVQGLQVLGTLQKPLALVELEAACARYIPFRRNGSSTHPQAVTHDALEQAIRNGEIVAYFQPKVRIDNGAMVGAEVLARWPHRDHGMIEPAHFIPLAERDGLIEPLTWLMLESAMQQAVIWDKCGHAWRLSVNLSLCHLEQTNVADRVAALAERYGVRPERIVLEVTESLAAVNLAPILGNLARLRMKGFGVAIDDYGTGYSSLEQLSRIPFTELKIDRSFVNGAAKRPNLRTILGSSIELARQLHLESVAEGVETEDDLKLLRELGCDLAQGKLIGAPMPSAELNEWVARIGR